METGELPPPRPILRHSETLRHTVPYVFLSLKSFEFTGDSRMPELQSAEALEGRLPPRCPSATRVQRFLRRRAFCPVSQHRRLEEGTGLTLHGHPVHRRAPPPRTTPHRLRRKPSSQDPSLHLVALPPRGLPSGTFLGTCVTFVSSARGRTTCGLPLRLPQGVSFVEAAGEVGLGLSHPA